jgi:hypothetical protein
MSTNPFESIDKFSQVKTRDGVVDPRVVEKLHQNADTDNNQLAVHHTLGPGHNQASPGDHSHDGGTSTQLLEGVTLSGSKGGNAALASVVAALVGLGATDSTT